MKRFLTAGLVVGIILAGLLVGEAQITIPYTFTAGTSISSSQVNSNFTAVASALNRTGGTMTGTLTSQAIIPGLTNTYALGGSSFTFSTAYITDGSNILNVSASNLGTGTIPNGVFPATLPALSGVNLTALNASNLGSGTVPVARLPTYLAPTEFSAGNSSTAITINFSTNGPVQKVTRTGSATYTLVAPANAGTVILKFVHEASATAYTVSFSPGVKFSNGVTPTWTNTSGAIDIVTFYWDGTTWFGVQTPAFS